MGTTGEATNQDINAPDCSPEFLGKVGLNLALAWLLPVAVIKLHVGGLHAVGWVEGPRV